MGINAAQNLTNGTQNAAFGVSALGSNTNTGGSYNTAIGAFAGSSLESGNNNVFIGYRAGHGVTNPSNKLYIQNSFTIPPLIVGEFSATSPNVKISGSLETTSNLNVTGNITVTGTVDGVDIAAAHASYETDEIYPGQNILMNTGVSVTSDRIVDIMSDALADKSNANSKKFIGFHLGSGVCVLQGMVDAAASISGSTEGGPLWLGTSGAFSATAPTTATHYSRVVGYYVGSGVGGEEICYFDPSKDWIQID
jgi:hypothetical protein